MFDLLLNEDASVRLSVFIVVFAVFALWEWLAPRRIAIYPKSVRWTNNLAISLINVFATRLIIPVTLVFVAVKAEVSNIGLLNVLDLPALVTIVIAVLLFYFAIYTTYDIS